MEDTEIYEQTQKLAKEIAMNHGFDCPSYLFKRYSKNPRATMFFESAVIAQKSLNCHEMEDVIDSIEK